MLPDTLVLPNSASGLRDYQVRHSDEYVTGAQGRKEVRVDNDTSTEGLLLGRRERELLQKRFKAIVTRLEDYEEKYGRDSASFYNAFERRELSETPDYLRWRSVYYAYLQINERYGLSK